MNAFKKSDSWLMQRVAKGDSESFEVIVNRYQQSVADLAFRFLANSYDAEDIAQETFVRLFQSAKYYRPGYTLKAYILKIAKNLCLDHLKKKDRCLPKILKPWLKMPALAP